MKAILHELDSIINEVERDREWTAELRESFSAAAHTCLLLLKKRNPQPPIESVTRGAFDAMVARFRQTAATIATSSWVEDTHSLLKAIEQLAPFDISAPQETQTHAVPQGAVAEPRAASIEAIESTVPTTYDVSTPAINQAVAPPVNTAVYAGLQVKTEKVTRVVAPAEAMVTRSASRARSRTAGPTRPGISASKAAVSSSSKNVKGKQRAAHKLATPNLATPKPAALNFPLNEFYYDAVKGNNFDGMIHTMADTPCKRCTGPRKPKKCFFPKFGPTPPVCTNCRRGKKHCEPVEDFDDAEDVVRVQRKGAGGTVSSSDGGEDDDDEDGGGTLKVVRRGTRAVVSSSDDDGKGSGEDGSKHEDDSEVLAIDPVQPATSGMPAYSGAASVPAKRAGEPLVSGRRPPPPSPEFMEGSSCTQQANGDSSNGASQDRTTPAPTRTDAICPGSMAMDTTDRLACAAAFLRGAVEQQENRVKLAASFEREASYFRIAGYTLATHFHDHGIQLLAALRTMGHRSNDPLERDLVNELREINKYRHMIAQAQPTLVRATIDYGPDFWTVVSKIGEAFMELGYSAVDIGL